MPVSAPQIKSASGAVETAPPGKNWFKNIALILVWQMIALLFVEAALYGAGLGEEEIFKLDPVLGVKHMTNKRITHRTEGFAQSYLNADGMREPGLTVAKPANTYRIATMGDSMVEGMQVPIEKTFGAVAGKSLSTSDGKRIQVLNFGTSGYSTAQEYLQLKSQVLKYKPDLVVLCYNSRDIFENWSPADQVITNVRPFALHLPGGQLNVDSSPVVRWMGTPRARFLLNTSWLREHSRIFGLLCTLELDWSQHNPWYRALLEVYQHPKKAMNELRQALAAQQSGPAFQIKFFEDGASKPLKEKPSTVAAVSVQPSVAATGQSKSAEHTFNSATGNDTLAQNQLLKAPGSDKANKSAAGVEKPASGINTYKALIKRTLGSLFAEMRDNCRRDGADFVIASLPNRARLCPAVGMETAFAGIDYQQELEIVADVCHQSGIAFLDCEQSAEKLNYPEREALFYSVHLRPEGHEFMAKQLTPFLQTRVH